MNKIFLIILNWEHWELTLNCLKSVNGVDTDGFLLEVVVLDNGSLNDSVKKIQEFKFSNSEIIFSIIENKTNEGFARGNNIAAEYAVKNNADYICLLNNDVRVDKNFLKELFESCEKDKNIGLAGGKIYFEKGYEFYKDKYKDGDKGKVIWYAGGKIDWNNVYGSNRGVDEVDNGQFENEQETDFVNGCLMFIRTEILKKCVLFNEKYYLYYEDTDFSQRVKRLGYKLVYCPKSIIWHINAGSSSAGSNLHEYFTTRNRMLFGMKYASWRVKISLLRESIKLYFSGRPWQRIGIKDFYLNKFGKGSWK